MTLVLSIWLGGSLLLALLYGLLGLGDTEDLPLGWFLGWPVAVVLGLIVGPFYLAGWLGKKIREAMRP